MNSIFNKAIRQVEQGHRFNIDLSEKSFKLNGKYVIKNGVAKGELGVQVPHNPIDVIEKLFYQYQHSIPSERSDSRCRNYFRALAEDELEDADMMYGEPREVARLRLELYILCAIIQNKIDWESFASGKWFWQSEKHPSLIILKKWITNN